MTDHQLKETIRQAYQRATPDVWDAVLSDCGDQKGRVSKMTTEKKRKKRMTQLAGLAACLCLILGGGFGIRGYHINHTVDATVSLDVNPSVEIQVNQKERVLDVVARNEDGKIIVGDMDLSGSSLQVAVNALIGSMLQNGYLNELTNSILISVDNNDPVRGAALQERLTAEVNQLLQTDTFSGSVLSQTVMKDDALQQMADQYGITLGKAQLIQDILNANSLHTFDELAPLTINELNLLLGNEPAASAHVAVVGTASEKGYIGEDRARMIAVEKAGVSASDLTSYEVELDTHQGVMVYDVEFTANGYEVDCEIHAVTGEIVKFEREYHGADSPAAPRQNGDSQSGEITLEKAKEIALNHAGVNAADAAFEEAKSDYDDGRLIYELKFKVSSGSTYKKYDYEIAASDGSILGYDCDTKGDAAPPSGIRITMDEAKEIALNHAGISSSDAIDLKGKLYQGHGKSIYEIEFEAGGYEYEYEIDTATGTILAFDKDWDD